MLNTLAAIGVAWAAISLFERAERWYKSRKRVYRYDDRCMHVQNGTAIAACIIVDHTLHAECSACLSTYAAVWFGLDELSRHKRKNDDIVVAALGHE